MKRGRKQHHHIDSRTGKPIVGLSRMSDGKRWRIIGTQERFTEPDEQKAIEKFRRLTGKNLIASVGVKGIKFSTISDLPLLCPQVHTAVKRLDGVTVPLLDRH